MDNFLTIQRSLNWTGLVENEYEGELPLHSQGLDPQVFANLVLNKIHITRPVTKKLHVDSNVKTIS